MVHLINKYTYNRVEQKSNALDDAATNELNADEVC